MPLLNSRKKGASLARNNNDIAVIGMAGRFPGAQNYEQLWELLISGKSAIREVPADRWRWEQYWGDPKTETNKSNSKWGGFLDKVGSFDADFFGISPREVESMDPQQRIMLELTWSCLEDAAIRPSTISGKNVGVFVGVFNFDYKELQERGGARPIEAHHSTGTASAIIPNRISYYFNFRGPSIPIDTACSSSLNAIHAAVQSLRQGDAEMTIAGGINLLLTPTRHISFSKTGMLSPTGACKTFDDHADGYVRGEGAGLVLLKPLPKALADGNNIIGIVKGSAVNHGGRTYSLTYPNPEAQRDVIAAAQSRASVAPEQIGYIEAHGTGTPKGDPIEFKGLVDAFSENISNGKRRNFCGLGSVKTNVGHLEAAAGVTGVIKVLLSMKYGMLPPLQNYKNTNHRIVLDGSPFFLVKDPTDWKRFKGKGKKLLPLRAGVSSFGFGGTNAHVVLEEAPQRLSRKKSGLNVPYFLICLSAKTPEALVILRENLRAWLTDEKQSGTIEDISKTLSNGREHFEVREAFIVENVDTLKEQLATGAPASKTLFHSRARQTPATEESTSEDLANRACKALSRKKINKRDYYDHLSVVAAAYVDGLDFDWSMPWFGGYGKSIALPTYPFAANHYWITHEQSSQPPKESASIIKDLNMVRGSGVGGDVRFHATFSGEEFFLRDHLVNGERILPAVVYLEMIRTVVEAIRKTTCLTRPLVIRNIGWTRAFAVSKDPVPAVVSLREKGNDILAFEISNQGSSNEPTPTIFSQGIVDLSAIPMQETLAVADLLKGGKTNQVLKTQCYDLLRQMGFDYGPSHQPIVHVYVDSHELWARLELPSEVRSSLEMYPLHPSLTDGALQAALLLSATQRTHKEELTHLPFAASIIEFLFPCSAEMWVRVQQKDFGRGQQSNTKNFDIVVCNADGVVCVRMKSFAFAPTRSQTPANEHESKPPLLSIPVWIDQVARRHTSSMRLHRRVAFLCGFDNETVESLKSRHSGVELIRLPSSSSDLAERYGQNAQFLMNGVKALLKHKVPGSKVMVQLINLMDNGVAICTGLFAILRTAQLEDPYIVAQCCEVDGPDHLTSILSENDLAFTNEIIRYKGGSKKILQYVPQQIAGTLKPWKNRGKYLITGGAGGLGLIFANEIASTVHGPSIILAGRSDLSITIQSDIAKLQKAGAEVLYAQTDVTNRLAVEELKRKILAKFGALDGIIHTAGVLHDGFILTKSSADLMDTLAPKLSGTVHLDEATADLHLDFFVLFSSIVSLRGNPGQADYAAANAFMDKYATYRNGLVAQKQRSGKTLSINWPLWKEGGMQLPAALEREFVKRFRVEPIETGHGLSALYQAMMADADHVAVGYADLREGVGSPIDIDSNGNNVFQHEPPPAATKELTIAPAIAYVTELLSATLKRPVVQIDPEALMERYGIDSIMVMQMTNQLENIFGSLPKTLFFEYLTIKDLAGYFIDNHFSTLQVILDSREAHGAVKAGQPATKARPLPELSAEHNTPLINSSTHAEAKECVKSGSSLEIAIVGLSGRYPMASNVQEYWTNLREGKDCITEIPKERWDYRNFFNEDKNNHGTTYAKWGGFINDVDKFDPLFFNISPLDAERIDPQERLFLQCVYEAIEDAGYTRLTLGKDQRKPLSNDVGVYVGVMYEEYQLFGAQEALLGRPVSLWGLPSSIANRVSYFCDFHGPSMAVDTMCSSSLTAIHLACESIARGNCSVAIAGGVNVSIHPNKFLFLSQGRFASSNGRCESFGTGGDGYVPGEGVGAVVLKPLSDAIADGDNIYGVIKSTSVNHGGKTNGYTVPSPRAQETLLDVAFSKGNINPRAISYIEAHGTGTSLGDPIEISGLTKAFARYTSDVQFCAIGSAKSNIGHCESAAGIAGLTKVLLQMKFRKLVPSLHSTTLNKNIDFATTPFNVQQEIAEWRRPVITVDGVQKEYPRIAGISSFGAGGANAHLVVEEYQHVEAPRHEYYEDSPALVLLSGRDQEALTAGARALSMACSNDQRKAWRLADSPLKDIAYTTQVGREHFDVRLAIVANSVSDLEAKLAAYLEGADHSDLRKGFAEVSKAHVTEGELSVLERDDLLSLGNQWIQGARIDWSALYKSKIALPRRLSLPTYPFKKERYWIGKVVPATNVREGHAVASHLHPLLHQNISDLTSQRFRVSLTGEEFYLADHVIHKQKLLPAAAYIEMIREAVCQSLKSLKCTSMNVRILQITWVTPCVVDNKSELIVALRAEGNEQVQFEIVRESTETVPVENILCQGVAFFVPVQILTPRENLKAILSSCPQMVTREEAYNAFMKAGLSYGTNFQCLETVHRGDNRILAKISLPQSQRGEPGIYFLHPALVDSGLQATLLMNGTSIEDGIRVHLPFEMNEIAFHRALPSEAWVLITIQPQHGANAVENIFNIRYYSVDGELCAEFEHAVFRVVAPLKHSDRPKADEVTFLLSPSWTTHIRQYPAPTFQKHLVLLTAIVEDKGEVPSLPGVNVEDMRIFSAREFGDQCVTVFARVQEFLKENSKFKTLVQIIGGSTIHGDFSASFTGLLRSAEKENPNFHGQVIQLSSSNKDFATVISENAALYGDKMIRYASQNKRETLSWGLTGDDLHANVEFTPRPWKDGGVYLITGGAGELGILMAKEIAANASDVKVILCGRSTASNSQLNRIDNMIKDFGAHIRYVTCNVADRQSVTSLIGAIKAEFGTLDGIIHSAGVTRDSFLIQKTRSQWQDVLAPKVNGVLNLDLLTIDQPLDFMLLFSSVSGALGNIGQADYATANAFMDGYASYRNGLVRKGLRRGRTLSLNWPLWKEGGMRVDADAEKFLFDTMGTVPLSTGSALAGLYNAWRLSFDQVMVLEGNAMQIRKTVMNEETSASQLHRSEKPDTGKEKSLLEKTASYIKALLSSEIKLPVDAIRAHVSLEEYGIDSVVVMKLTSKLEKVFGTLSKTLLFEYQSIRDLAHYFYAEHYEALSDLFGGNINCEENQQSPRPAEGSTVLPSVGFRALRSSGFTSLGQVQEKAKRPIQQQYDIAIVGISGRYPQADNITAFWRNLIQGKDCVTEIPIERWDSSKYYHPDPDQAGKTYSKWGGFISGVDEFDPLFFNISPSEAELMDPQERLFLQCACETFQDAGYNKDALSDNNGLQGNVGVFVGVMYEEYQLFGAEQSAKGDNIALFGNPSSIANRVSYFYNLDGPSMAIDTMCSSSSTAIHLACQSILSGDCKAAIAGGVNVSIHPNKYILLAQGKFISSNGRCESFGVGGNGYVPSEGVGAVFLKPLHLALEDGDQIYGVIKSTAINHGGKTNGYTVPNPVAQGKVISHAFSKAGINPRTISYVEAHGTGTSLGDPIEIAGLKRAFSEHTADNGFCSLGSVKSNIGHCESAAGIAALTKVLLQMKHHVIVPTLHTTVLNPHIDFANSPFKVQQELGEWKRPSINLDGTLRKYARRAGISSFGAGGSNAHLLIEEYDNTIRSSHYWSQTNPGESFIILLSARGTTALRTLVQRIVEAINDNGWNTRDLPSMAFTLQTGREHLNTRLATIVQTIDELNRKLTSFLDDDQFTDDVYHGTCDKNNKLLDSFEDDVLQEAIAKWIAMKRYSKICEFWVAGLKVDWSVLYKFEGASRKFPIRMSLPSYPFERERYWVPANSKYAEIMNASVVKKEMPTQPSPINSSALSHTPSLEFFDLTWQATSVKRQPSPEYQKHLIVFVGMPWPVQKIREVLDDIRQALIINLEYNIENDTAEFRRCALLLFRELKNLLLSPHDGKMLVQIIIPDDARSLAALYAMVKTTYRENPNLVGQVIELARTLTPGQMSSVIRENASVDDIIHVRYLQGQRQIALWTPYQKPGLAPRDVWKNQGVYLITGGAGGVGSIVAGEIVHKTKDAVVILIGRSAIDENDERLQSLRKNGATVKYHSLDILSYQGVRALISDVYETYGQLNGIIHCAGITRDSFAIKKTEEEWNAVLDPKVNGLINLDEATKDKSIDFLVLFSSIASVSGNAGQVDYATANAFMDAFAAKRNAQRKSGQRSGHAISINWPLWKAGGMNVQNEMEETLFRESGMWPLESETAIDAFYHAMSASMDQIAVVYGYRPAFEKRFFPRKPDQLHTKSVNPKRDPLPTEFVHDLQTRTVAELKSLFGTAVKLAIDRIDALEEFHAYGLNSVMIVQLNSKLEAVFGELSKTLFYEHPNLSKLAAFLVRNHTESCIRWTGLQGDQALHHSPSSDIEAVPRHPSSDRKTAAEPELVSMSAFASEDPIVIIGVCGRYPKAPSLKQYWNNLANGSDCISEVPEQRWDFNGIYESDRQKAVENSLTYSRWGGFLDDYAEFDPLFFNISPREAVAIDPQERIFLQASWEVLEDAGYTIEQLETKFNGRVGVFAGVTKTGFELYSPALWANGSSHRLRTSFSSVANRVSYHFNLKGPSIAIDTMCSASLTAIHEACESIKRGECEMAIAGGVNLYLHPLNYIDLCAQNFLSSDGKCRSFGQGGTGFVPGEGVGVILLKRQSRALGDGDPIHAIIRGTGINHGGRTSGYTVPNPTAQAELIRETLKNAGVDARAISYVEAHGTGTSLGDPIEMAGLSQAFQDWTSDTEFCALGSVKSNIGHLEAAAGIAGVTKVILQMRHGMLVPTLHATETNPNINFSKSPFCLQSALSPWVRPVLTMQGQQTEQNRLATVSSFGAGGANAHIILEEYRPSEVNTIVNTISHDQRIPAIIVLSARDRDTLHRSVLQLMEHVSSADFNSSYATLLNAAYTLQVGRQAMQERFGIIARSVNEVIEGCKQFINGDAGQHRFMHGKVNDKKEALNDLHRRGSGYGDIERWIVDGQHQHILSAWIKGVNVPWEKLYHEFVPARISLPAYPFAKTKYWLPREVTHPQRPIEKSLLPYIANTEDIVVDKDHWLFTGEEWVSDAYPEIDWKTSLYQLAPKKICVVYNDPADCEALASLIKKIAQAASLADAPEVYAVHASLAGEKPFGDGTPDVVVVFGPGAQRSSEHTQNNIQPVYEVSQWLMKHALNEKIELYYLFEATDHQPRIDCEALTGFFLSAMKENAQHIWRSVCIKESTNVAQRQQFLLQECLWDTIRPIADTRFRAVRFYEGKRFRWQLKELDLQSDEKVSFRRKGNYVVAGGVGYIGTLLVEQLLRTYDANIFLLSKSPLDEKRVAQCKHLEKMGGVVTYLQCDVADESSVRRAFARVKEKATEVHGLINLARAHDSQGIISKPWKSFNEICKVKVQGTINLDEITKNEPLDFFLLFASIGAYGARGDSDYAYSVSFQNAFARFRNGLTSNKERNGLTISQCWGPWVEDRLFPESRKRMKALGLDLINMKSAFPCIERSISYPNAVIGMCMVLDKDKVKEVLGVVTEDNEGSSLEGRVWKLEQEKAKGLKVDTTDVDRMFSVDEIARMDNSLVERIYDLISEGSAEETILKNQSEPVSSTPDADAFNAMSDVLCQSFREVLQLKELDRAGTFQAYGLDSIMAMRLSIRLSKVLGMDVSPHKFIEYPTVELLTEHLLSLQDSRPISSVHSVGDNRPSLERITLSVTIKALAEEVLQIADIKSDLPLQDYGMDSIIAMRLAIRLERKIDYEIKPSLLIEFPTVDALSRHLQSVIKPILI